MGSLSRRRFLQAAGAGATSAGLAGSTRGAQSEPSEPWEFDTGARVRSSPAVADGTLYLGNQDGILYAIDAGTGTEQWRFETDSHRLQSSPAVDSGTVYVTTRDGFLHAVDTASGDEQWRFGVDSIAAGSPAIHEGTVFFGTTDRYLYAVDTDSGDEVWRSEQGFRIESTPAVADGTVFIGRRLRGFEGLDALDAETGDTQWQSGLDNTPAFSPALGDETIYVRAGWSLVAIAIDDGSVRWRFDDAEVRTPPTVVDNTVYFGTWDRGVIALSTETRERRWSYEVSVPSQHRTAPTVSDGMVFVSSRNLYAIDQDSGDLEWEFLTEGRIRTRPAVSNGMVYIGTDEGIVHARPVESGGSSLIGQLDHHTESIILGLFSLAPAALLALLAWARLRRTSDSRNEFYDE